MSGELDPLESGLAEWCERTLAGEQIDATAFARQQGLPEAEFAARAANARWLVARHVENRPAPAPQPPFRLVEAGVTVDAEVGRGAMGVVFRGHREADGRPLAVKLLAPHVAGEQRARERLRREATAAMRLRHANAVAVLEYGEHDGFPFLVMEWVDGETLANLVDRRRRAGLGTDAGYARETAHLLACIAHALQQAHEQGLLHRDVKPSNILIDTHGTPFLADFGLVRDLAAATLTDSGAVVGSPAYLAPELLEAGGRATPQSDVYALGVTLHECLTLRRPFEAETESELRQSIRDGRIAPLTAIDAGVPEPLDRVCRKACAWEPGTRYPSAAAFAADLEAFARGEPVAARPAGLGLRLRRLARRNRRGIRTGVALGGGLAVVVLGLSLYGSLRAARAAARQDMRDRLWTVEASGDDRLLARMLGAAEREFPDDPEVRLKRAIGLLQRGGPADFSAQAGRLVTTPLDDAGLEPVRGLLAAAIALAIGEGPAQDVERACETLRADAALPPRAALLSGRALLVMGWIAHAEQLLARVGGRDPRLATIAAECLAECHYRSGRYAQALESCAAFATVYDTPARRYLVVRYANGARMPEQARLAAGELARRHPDSAFNDAAALLLGQERTSDEVLARARRRADWAQAQPAIERLLITGYLADGQLERAIEVLERFLAESPRDPSLRGILGTTLLQKDRREEGLEQLRKAAEDGDRLPFERDLHWGVFHFYAGDLEKAVEHYRAAARLCPNDPMRLRPLAGALAARAKAAKEPTARIARWREVVEVQEQETRCAPEDPRARHLLGAALASLARALEATGDPEAAAVRARREELGKR